MITARAYLENNVKTQRLASFDDDEPTRSIQLYGIDAENVGRRRGAKLVETDHVDHIDLNFGCPAPKVTRNGGGAALPVRRRLLRDIIRAAVSPTLEPIPITVKFRMGTDDDHLTYLDTGRIAEAEGCAAVALHARTATQLYSGEARWAAIGELKEVVTSIPVLGNGDIWEATDAHRDDRTRPVATVWSSDAVASVDPWLFRDLAAAFAGRGGASATDTRRGQADTMIRHIDLLGANGRVSWLGESASSASTPAGTSRGTRSEARSAANSTNSRAANSWSRYSDGLSRGVTMTPEGPRAKRGHQGRSARRVAARALVRAGRQRRRPRCRRRVGKRPGG